MFLSSSSSASSSSSSSSANSIELQSFITLDAEQFLRPSPPLSPLHSPHSPSPHSPRSLTAIDREERDIENDDSRTSFLASSSSSSSSSSFSFPLSSRPFISSFRRLSPLPVFLSVLILSLFISTLVLSLRLYDASSSSSPASSSSSSPGSPSSSCPSCSHPSVLSPSSLVTTTHYLASRIGLSFLRQGGNAFDAAIAVQLALGVVQPQSTGLGGGLYALIHKQKASAKQGEGGGEGEGEEGEVWALDGREEAPEALSPWAFCANAECRALPSASPCNCSLGPFPFLERCTGGGPVAVPGVPAALFRLFSDHASGLFSLPQLAAPAIQLAEEGFPMYQELWDRLMINRERMSRFPSTRALFFPNGSFPLWLGQTVVNPDLAATYRLLTSSPSSLLSFYSSPFADALVDAARSFPNPLTGALSPLQTSDFAAYRAVYRPVLRSSFKLKKTGQEKGKEVEQREEEEVEVLGMSGSSSGASTLLLSLNLLFSLPELPDLASFSSPSSSLFLSRFIDVQDAAFADRALFIGDRDWADVPDDVLLSADYARQRVEEMEIGREREGLRWRKGGTVPAGNISVPTAVQEPPTPSSSSSSSSSFPSVPFSSLFAPSPPSPKSGTTHFSIVDSHGNAVSLTSTIEENFGSGVVVPGKGFILNNELTDFTALPREGEWGEGERTFVNAAEGGKRERRTALGSEEERSALGGKRPMSSMTPTIVRRRSPSSPLWRPFLLLGSPGGSYIIGCVLNALVNILLFDFCLGDAVAAGRKISQNGPTQIEDRFLNDPKNAGTLDRLREKKYEIEKLVTQRPAGFVEGIKINKQGENMEGIADARLGSAEAVGL